MVIGLVAAVGLLFATLANALTDRAPLPVSEKVQQYYESNKVLRTPAAPGKKVVSIGDSYSAGAGGIENTSGFIYQLGRSQSWNLTDLARGGTGYLSSITSNAKVACGLDYCPSYPEMIVDAAAVSPDIVIVAGGRNDAARAAAEEANGVAGFYQKLRAALPTAQIIAISPLWDATMPPSSLGDIAAEVRSAVESVGGTYLDIGQPLQGMPELVSADKVHPNDAGHAALFKSAQAKLLEAAL